MLLVIQNQPADNHPRKVFVSYSHKDETWKQKVVNALKPLEDQHRIAAWHDRKLLPGQEWDGEIKQELELADVILLLISPAFIKSRYCRDVEIKRAVDRSEEGTAVLVPIIVSRCAFDKEPFARFQAYPVDGSPLDEVPDPDTKMRDLREKLQLALLGWWYPRRPRGKGEAQAVWQLQIRAGSETEMPSDEQIITRLRELAGEPDIISCGRSQEQSVDGKTQSIDPILLINGSHTAFTKFESLHHTGKLSQELGVQVIHFNMTLGATMQVSSEIMDSRENLPDEENLLMEPSVHDTPDLPQILVTRDEQPGWMLVFPGRLQKPTPWEVFAEVQARFTRYFGTILAVPDGRLTVNLSTYEPDKTLIESLRGTELGHDLMEQDCLLKQYTASLLHPDNPVGKAYWAGLTEKARDITGSDRISLQAYQKTWIVPGKNNSVQEKTPDHPFGFSWPESFGVKDTDRACGVTSCELDVLCETDYLAIEHYQKENTNTKEKRLITQLSEASVSLFRELVIPAIRTEVNEGTHFTRLRQIYFAFVLATWFRREMAKLPEYSSVFDVADKGIPEAFGVPRNEDWNVKGKAIYERYLQLFEHGVFRCARTEGESARIYFSGGVALK